jgi:hypothetical protein
VINVPPSPSAPALKLAAVDVHHHILPDFFWRVTNDAHGPVGGIAPPPWDTGCSASGG